MQAKSTQILAWAIVGTCALVIALNYLYRWPLYHKGIDLIIQMQQDSNLVFDWFFLLVTMIIDPTVVFGICALMLVLSRKKRTGYVMLVFLLLNTFCAAVMKAYDCDPRPIWTAAEVRNIGFYCPVEYGNPSGHSWFSAIFGFTVLTQYWGNGKYYSNLVISVLAVVLMPISRMYLGAHSLNQVLQGVLLGLAMSLLYLLVLRSQIEKYLLEFNKNSMWKLVIVACHVIYFIPFIGHRKEELPAQWEKNIADKCNVVMNESKLNTLMFLVNAVLVSAATGIGMGFETLHRSKYGEYYLQGKWEINEQKYELKYGYFLFIMVELACILSGLVAGGLISWMVPHIAVAYLALSVGAVASGYVYTTKTCYYLDKFRIIRKLE